jgi:tRNA G18 (ribose-2'-O)-methylase SpoU
MLTSVFFEHVSNRHNLRGNLMTHHTVTDSADPRLDDYLRLTDVTLRRVKEPADGLYIAESLTILGRALDAGHQPRSVLTSSKWLPALDSVLTAKGATSTDVLVADDALIESVTGFAVHRGTLASMHRPKPADPMAILQGARRLVILEDIVDHTNVGALFRSVAGIGADAVWVSERCADPYYRRSIRVSMGTVFQVPWARIGQVADMANPLRQAGWETAALALANTATDIDTFAEDAPERLALLLGTEGDGLQASSIAVADHVVRIPMRHGVDSLNVAAAGAVAMWTLRY